VEFLKRAEERQLPNIAYTLQVGRAAYGIRDMVVCSDLRDAVSRLQENGAASGSTAPVTHSRRAPVVFMFTGQGSQYVNMAKDLYEEQPIFRQVLMNASGCSRRR